MSESDLLELRGKSFDLVLQRVLPRRRGQAIQRCVNCGVLSAPRKVAKAKGLAVHGGHGLCEICYDLWRRGNLDVEVWPSIYKGEIVSPLDSLGVDNDTVLVWRRGQKIPRASTLRRIMPLLEALGVPAEIWWDSWQIAKDSRPDYYRNKSAPVICSNGHDLVNSTIRLTKPRKRPGHNERLGVYVRCDECVKQRYEAEKERVSKLLCSYCGKKPPAVNRRDGLCGACARRKFMNGDPSIYRGPPPGGGKSGYIGVHERPEGGGRYGKRWTTKPYAGIYADPEEAARARDAKVIELGLPLHGHGSSKLNFPVEST